MLTKCGKCGNIVDRIPGQTWMCPICKGGVYGGRRMPKEWYEKEHKKCEEELKTNKKRRERYKDDD